MKTIIIILLVVICATPIYTETAVKDSVTIKPQITLLKLTLLKNQIKTRYDINGRAVNQSQDAKGLHRVVGSVTLINGVDTVLLNTSTADGKQDISFINGTTYSGRAWATNIMHRANTYSILPLSGKQFIVVSSSATDTAFVYYILEGE